MPKIIITILLILFVAGCNDQIPSPAPAPSAPPLQHHSSLRISKSLLLRTAVWGLLLCIQAGIFAD